MGKKKHDAHHGGAWKVAYADFVTAMMALFMVLWIVGQSEEIVEATSRYFQDPYIVFDQQSSGSMEKHMAGTSKQSDKMNPDIPANEGFLRAVARDFTRLINIKTEEESPVQVELTSDGLKITIFNQNDKPLFQQGTAKLTEWGGFVLQNLAWLVERHQFRVFIDGHTSKTNSKPSGNYGPWELSADRANTARRTLEYFAVNPEKIERVTGYGDSSPVANATADAPKNERITISLSAEQDMPPPQPAKP